MHRYALATALGLLVVAANGQAVNQPAPVKGVLVGVGKAADTDTGLLQVKVDGSDSLVPFTVNGDTIFEKVFHNKHSRSAFLAEHRGENVVVFAQPGAAPQLATKVEVLFEDKPMHVHGHVTSVDAGSITVVVHHAGYHVPPPQPPPPVPAPMTGVIAGITKAEDGPTGTITIKSDPGAPPAAAASQTFVITEGTAFETVRGTVHKASTFLLEHDGEKAVIFPSIWNPLVASKVEILLVASGAAVATPTKKPAASTNSKAHRTGKARDVAAHDDLLTFKVDGATRFETVRDKEHRPATFALVQPGEEVVMISQLEHHRQAAKVEIRLPYGVHGVVQSRDNASITLTVHHKATKTTGVVPDTTARFAVDRSTQFVEGKKQSPATLAQVQPGANVVVFGNALPTLPAAKVEVTVQKTKPIHLHGPVLSVSAGTMTINAQPPSAKAGSGAGPVLIALNASTRFESHDRQLAAAGVAGLTPGREVSIVASPGQPPLAISVEMHAAKKPAGTKPHKKTASTKTTRP